MSFTLAHLDDKEEAQCLQEMNQAGAFLRTFNPNYQLAPYRTAFQKLCWFHGSYAIFSVIIFFFCMFFHPDLWAKIFFKLLFGYLFAWVPLIAWCYRPTERSGPVQEKETQES